MGTDSEHDGARLSDPLPKAFTDAKASEERSSRRRRVRETERVANAIEVITRALEPLTAESRVRVVRAVIVLLDVPMGPEVIRVPGELLAGG